MISTAALGKGRSPRGERCARVDGQRSCGSRISQAEISHSIASAIPAGAGASSRSRAASSRSTTSRGGCDRSSRAPSGGGGGSTSDDRGERGWRGPEAKPLERQLIKREVVRVEAAWLKRKKGNPNLNPRGFQVICTLSGGMDPATAKKASIGSKPPPLIKDQREPPFKSIAVDVKEFPDAYMFVADVPGLRNTDIKIDVVNDRFMTISGGRSRNDEPGAYYISLERTMGKFIRKFQLPGNSNLDAMRAGCQDGVLTIFVPMAPPLAEPVVRPVLDVAWDRRKSKG
ncbi:uncharacterized protein LOC9654606 [Selaginella moellendorffii]|nr:uncharacterized protein LOC9654606 [Selaginella moellendorffii]|eukprot:XP_002983270.2 uncharacterized protein LOC9654606 [Selaginella moellendorffii]